MIYFFVCDHGSLVGHRMQDYKCLCTAVTICATLIFPKFDLSILIPLTSKSSSISRDLLHPCQVHPRSKFGDRSFFPPCLVCEQQTLHSHVGNCFFSIAVMYLMKCLPVRRIGSTTTSCEGRPFCI